ncbi:MAG: ATP-binding protein [Elusimicrobia bacterium]|nr:ATP-binding protein [Elusimicrobiota bacterium]
MATSQPLPFTFSDRFLEDHAGQIIVDPLVAIIELIANAYDAGASNVKITWPVSSPGRLVIEDDGTGMSREEFESRWRELCYNRLEAQGPDVQYPPGRGGKKRQAFGRNGKGRHAGFCFADSYIVESQKDGDSFRAQVSRQADAPFVCEVQKVGKARGHGTVISAEANKNILPVATVIQTVGSKFAVDPSFQIQVNGSSVALVDLHRLATETVDVEGFGEIVLHRIDSEVQDRTSQLRGITWWVKGRMVGDPSWEGLDGEGNYLDGRTTLAKRFSFVVEADILKDSVKADWVAFRASPKVEAVREAVHTRIIHALNLVQAENRRERKRATLAQHRQLLGELSITSKRYVGQFIDELQEKCPTISEKDLARTVEIYAKMEQTTSGYDLLGQLAACSPEDIDKWNGLMKQWSAGHAEIVLNELERRLKLIAKLQDLVETVKTDELHDLQPLFERGLWMFGPEYEAVDFHSNRGLATIVRESLGGTTKNVGRGRPDFVALPERSIGVYAAASFGQDGEVSGVRKILIVELKKGGFDLKQGEVDQAKRYAKALRKAGDVTAGTVISAIVLGATMEADLDPEKIGDATFIEPMLYRTLLTRAHQRTFNLQKRLEASGAKRPVDTDVESVLEEKELPLKDSVRA